MKNHTSMAACLLIISLISDSEVLAKDDPGPGPSATITIASQLIAVGIGINWGAGTLTYKGKDYPFTVKGLSVMEVGVSKATAKGEVYHLTTVADFAGKYAALEGGFSLGKGASDITMKNTKGVVINLSAATEGIQLTLGGKGLSITFQEHSDRTDKIGKPKQETSSKP